MNSKICLEIIFEKLYLILTENLREDLVKPIKQDLDKLEKLEKAFDKACERLEYYTGTCPFEQELIYETNCDLNCKDTYKECWKKYFMIEVLHND